MKLFKSLILMSLIICFGILFAEDFDLFDDIDFGEESIALFSESGQEGKADSSSLLSNFPLWNKTGATRSREPLFFIPFRFIRDKSGAYPYLFFNMSNAINVNPRLLLSNEVNELLDKFEDGTLGADVQLFLDNVELLKKALRILPFVRRMTIQERRIGGVIEVGIVFDKFFAQLDTSILLSERNFWLRDKRKRQDLLNLISEFDSLGKGQVIKEVFGFGDSRIKVGYNDLLIDKIKFNIGASGILPTSDFFHEHQKSIISSKAGDSRTDLINDLMNIPKYIMIDPKLGTSHYGLGMFLDVKFEIVPKRFDFWCKFTYDHFLKGNEYRIYKSSKSISGVQLFQLSNSNVIPDDFPLEGLFPQVLRISLYPGDVFDATLGCDLKSGSLKLSSGIDFFVQGAERIKGIKDSNVDKSLFNLIGSESSRIVQNKLFSELSYRRKLFGNEVNFGGGGDVTVFTKGAGYDWTAFGKASLIF